MRLNEIFDKYNEDVQFLSVYIREAHPDDGWRSPNNLKDGVHYNEPRTDDERSEMASICQKMLELKMPMAIDTIDNEVEEMYVSLPIRLFLVDSDGMLAYVGDEGPRGFKPDEFEEAIVRLID